LQLFAFFKIFFKKELLIPRTAYAGQRGTAVSAASPGQGFSGGLLGLFLKQFFNY
jgi:hypothetical protein